MRAKSRGSIASQKAQRNLLKRRDRKERLRRHYEKLDMLRALLAVHEKQCNAEEIRDLARRINTIEQQIRYMGEEPK